MDLFKRKKKFGIAFGGGGARGLAEIGAMKALEENEIRPADMVSGTSVGSLIGAAYALGFTSDDILGYAKNIGVVNFMNYSFPGGDFKEMVNCLIANREKIFTVVRDSEQIEKLAEGLFGEKTFADTEMPFYAVAVDLKSGNEVVLDNGALSKACRASSSIPGVFTPTIIEDMILCDGYLLNNLPADVLHNKGAEIILGINITANAYSGCDSTKYFDVLFASIDIMSSFGKIKNRNFCDILVEPDLQNYKGYSLSEKSMTEMYMAGYEAMQKQIPQLKQLLH